MSNEIYLFVILSLWSIMNACFLLFIDKPQFDTTNVARVHVNAFPSNCLNNITTNYPPNHWIWRYNETVREQMYFAAKKIEGWSGELTFDALSIVGSVQRKYNVSGMSVGEIGVHQGKSFLWLESMSASHERVFAIDLFDMQQFNIDHSGGAGLSIRSFWNNVGPPIDAAGERRDHVTIIRAPSDHVSVCNFTNGNLYPVRMFSIDGSHTGQMTYTDMKLAARVLARGGCMFVDDYLNPGWLGVHEGVHRFIYEERDQWAPLAIIAGKYWICDSDYVDVYLNSLLIELPNVIRRREIELQRSMKITSSSRMYGVKMIFVEGS